MQKKNNLPQKQIAENTILDSRFKNIIKFSFYSLIFLTLFSLIILYCNYIYFHNRFFMQTRVGDKYIGGMTLEEAKSFFTGAIEDFQSNTIEITIGDQTKTTNLNEFNVEITTNDLLENIYMDQHPNYNTSFLEFIYSFIKNFEKYEEPLAINYNESEIQNVIYSKFEDITPLQEPQVIYQNGQFIVVEGQSGKRINEDSLSKIKIVFSYLYNEELTLQTEENTPTISSGQIAVIADAANALMEQELNFKAGSLTITEKLSEHPEWLILDFSTDIYANAIYSEIIYYKTNYGIVAGESAKPLNFSILLNEEEIEKFLNENIVNKIENHAQNIYLGLDKEGNITVEGTISDGYALETEEAVALIAENFKNCIYETELPISIQTGQIYDRTGLNLGINELIAYGESDFGYSNSSRENNIIVGLSRFQNVIIAPGDILNYADYIGPIDAAHGFLPGWVIKNQTQTALEYGGGICQTSTTLFRAAFNGGFPIIERHPHSYDVSYYRWPEPGLDASVYLPYASMQFKNDSPGHILIQQDVNTTTKRARVWIYGTDDGRKVEITGPSIYGKYWASTTYEVPSETLTPGERVLSHSAIAGYQTDWWRTVTYTDGRIENYTLHTSYTAVPATYLVGVGE